MSQRKTDHIRMAALSAPSSQIADDRFYYEPLLNAHPKELTPVSFLGQHMQFPLWISSMTGGSSEANKINKLLAEACVKFGLGIGLGSCRTLLKSDEYFDDFNLRPIMGKELPLYANLGIAQLEELVENNEIERIHELVDKLQADGLFVHVNPVQEWLQPEGDRFTKPPIETIASLIDAIAGRYKIIVKEVGQGIGPKSLEELLKLKIDGLEFAAYGGTNFASIEIMRNNGRVANHMYPIANIGHNADEMVEMVNEITMDHPVHCQQIIVSGGLQNFLDGFYLSNKCSLPTVYGMAGSILQKALESKESLFDFIEAEKQGYLFATSFLKIRK